MIGIQVYDTASFKQLGEHYAKIVALVHYGEKNNNACVDYKNDTTNTDNTRLR